MEEKNILVYSKDEFDTYATIDGTWDEFLTGIVELIATYAYNATPNHDRTAANAVITATRNEILKMARCVLDLYYKQDQQMYNEHDPQED